MAKRGFRVMDSDLHTMEPDDLWQRHLDEPFRKFTPTFARAPEGPSNQPTIQVGTLTIGEMTLRPKSVHAAADLHRWRLSEWSSSRRMSPDSAKR